MKLGILANQNFQSALNKLADQELPIQVSFKIRRIIKKMNDELKIFNDTKDSLINRFGEKSEDGNLKINQDGTVSLDLKRKEEWLKELNDLNNLETSLPKIYLSELGDKLTISANELLILDGLIVD